MGFTQKYEIAIKKKKAVFLPITQDEFSEFACVSFWAVKYATLMILYVNANDF